MHGRLLLVVLAVMATSGICLAGPLEPSPWAEDEPNSDTGHSDTSTRTRSLRNFFRVNNPRVNAPAVSVNRVSTPSVSTLSANSNTAGTGTAAVSTFTQSASSDIPRANTPIASAEPVVPQSTSIVSINSASASSPAAFFTPSINMERVLTPGSIIAFLEKAGAHWNTTGVDFGGRMRRDVLHQLIQDLEKPEDPVSDFHKRLSRSLDDLIPRPYVF